MTDMPGFLCRIGLHKWRYEDAVITRRIEIEPNFVPALHGTPIDTLKDQRTQAVLSKRQCEKCGIKEGKRFAEDDQGNKTPVSGWEKIA